MRLAFAAVALALLVTLAAPQGSGSYRTTASISLPSSSSASTYIGNWTRWEWPAVTHATSTDHASFAAILPVLFVGLLAPLVFLLVSAAKALQAPDKPVLASLFQRPPPLQTL